MMARCHLLCIIRRHSPHHRRSEKHLSLIPTVIILFIGLQCIGSTRSKHKIPHTTNGILYRHVPQNSLHIMYTAIFFKNGTFHFCIRIPLHKKVFHLFQTLFRLLPVSQNVSPRMIIPIGGFSIYSIEYHFHIRR